MRRRREASRAGTLGVQATLLAHDEGGGDSSRRSAIFPPNRPDAMNLNACAYSPNGDIRSIAGCNQWVRIKAIIFRKSARDPTWTP